LKNIFKDNELDKNSVVAFFATTAADGKTFMFQLNLPSQIATAKEGMDSMAAQLLEPLKEEAI